MVICIRPSTLNLFAFNFVVKVPSPCLHFFPVGWVYGFFLKAAIPASCWAKCVLISAADICEKWRIISQWGFGVLLMKSILRHFSLALSLISNGRLKDMHRKAGFGYFIKLKERKGIVELCNNLGRNTLYKMSS